MSRFRNSWFVALFWLVPMICACAFALLVFLVSIVRSGDISTTSAAGVAFGDNASYLQGQEVTSLEAAPETVLFAGPFDYSQLVLTAELAGGERIDVTQLATLVADVEKVTVTDDRRLMPIADGDEEITFEYGGVQATVHVVVESDVDPQPIRFITDVQPIFGRVGCNAGTCHGSQAGKNGFKLSLRGYDPLYDHRSLADDHAARRTNRAAPEQSLMLLKSTGQVPHEGGAVLELGSPYYKIIQTWIAEGVRFQADAPRVMSIEVFPKSATIPLPGMSQQFRIVATYTDGSSRDVTREAFLESGDTETATADRTGRLTAIRRGVAPVLVRFEGAYAVATATVMGDRDGFEWADAPAYSFIDELVYDKLRQLKIAPGELCTDAEFIRRATLDLVGLPPTPDEVRAFLDDGRDTQSKRDELIDRLVGSPDYIEHKTNKWADLLQVNGKFLSREGATAFREWIRKHMEANTPYDQFVREILTASGSNRVNPAASYFKILRDPQPTMENTTHLFLAIRFNCNKCHDHPFERWTQNQYYDLAAYFAQVELKRDPESGDRKIGGTAVEGAKPLYEEVLDKNEGEVRHVRTGEISPPKFPFEHDFDCPDDATRRQQLATWITSPENDYFTRSFVNRQWAYLLGVGVIEPIDDIRAGNPPSNPELLDRLTQEFIDSGFDVQRLVRTICKSRTYQLSIATNDWNDDDSRNYSHAYPRRLPAEVMLDAVHRVTGSPSHFPGVPPGTRAAQLPDAGIKLPDGFLDDLGRPARESACECERVNSLMLGPVMKLVNGPTIADAIVDPQNELAKLEAEVQDDAALVEELFLRILNRQPSADELAAGVATLAQGSDDVEQAQAAFAARQKAVDAEFGAWLAGQQIVRWHTLGRVEAATTNGVVLIPQPDHSLLAQDAKGKTAYTIVAYTDLPELTGIRLEALADERLGNNGPGGGGNFVLSEIRVSAAPIADPAAAKTISLKKPIADFNQNGFSVATAIDGKLDRGWGIHPQVGRDHTAVFTFAEPVEFDGGTRLVIVLDQQHSDTKHVLGRFRLSVTGTDRAIDLDPHPAEIMAVLRTRPDRRNDEQKASLVDYHRRLDADYVSRELAASRLTNPRLVGVQDLAWALINSPAFLFNR